MTQYSKPKQPGKDMVLANSQAHSLYMSIHDLRAFYNFAQTANNTQLIDNGARRVNCTAFGAIFNTQYNNLVPITDSPVAGDYWWDAGVNTAIDLVDKLSLSCWINLDDPTIAWQLFLHKTGYFTFGVNNRALTLGIWTGAWQLHSWAVPAVDWATHSWHWVGCTWLANGNVTFFFDKQTNLVADISGGTIPGVGTFNIMNFTPGQMGFAHVSGTELSIGTMRNLFYQIRPIFRSD